MSRKPNTTTTTTTDALLFAHTLADKLDRAKTPERRFNLAADAMTGAGDKSEYWTARRDVAATMTAREFATLYGTSAKARRDGGLVELFESAGYSTATARQWSSATAKLVDDFGCDVVNLTAIHAKGCACSFPANDVVDHRALTYGELFTVAGSIGCMSVLTAYQTATKARKTANETPADEPATDEPATDGPVAVKTASIDTTMARIIAELGRVSDMLKSDTTATIDPAQWAEFQRVAKNVAAHATANAKGVTRTTTAK